MLNALLNPEAKNPPKGAMREAKMESGREWKMAGYTSNTNPKNCTTIQHNTASLVLLSKDKMPHSLGAGQAANLPLKKTNYFTF